MAGLQPFSLAQVLSNAAGIQGQRMNNKLAELQFQQASDPNSLQNQLTKAKIAEAMADARGGFDLDSAPVKSMLFRQQMVANGATQEELDRFDSYVRAQQIRNIGGVDTVVGPGGQGNTPLSTLQKEIDAARQISGAEGFGRQAGTLAAQGGISPEGFNLTITGEPAQPIPSAADIEAQKIDTKQAAETASNVLDTADAMQSSVRTLQEARQAVLDGAGVGPLQRAWPSVRSASVRLDNARSRAGLDIVGATTFGALSKGELDLSLDTALPTNLEGPELIKWIDDRINAINSKSEYLRDYAIFLSTPDENGRRRTKADWAKHQKGIMDRALKSISATEADIKETMKVNKMNRSAVLREIRRQYEANGGT